MTKNKDLYDDFFSATLKTAATFIAPDSLVVDSVRELELYVDSIIRRKQPN